MREAQVTSIVPKGFSVLELESYYTIIIMIVQEYKTGAKNEN